MRIAIISDFHFGFGAGSERANDAYDAFKEAIEKALECDIILFAGDLFDERNPDMENFSKAAELMIKPMLIQNDIRLVQGMGKDVSNLSETAVMGTPIVAIHGTHERRTKGLVNPVEALEKAGFLIYLHCNGVIFEKSGERIAIQGMSGVPDQYAESVLSNWNPRPETGCFNVFILHQSITEFLYAPHTLDLNKLPKGFDLYINGHIHEAKESEYAGRPFLLTGSLIPTQIKEESEKPKGFWIVETSESDRAKGEVFKSSKTTRKNNMTIHWIELENQRKVYNLSFDGTEAKEIEEKLKKITHENPLKKPIVRIELKGTSEKLEDEIRMKFGSSLLISFKKEKAPHELPSRTIHEHKLSVEEMGRKILSENLSKAGLDPKTFESVFELLSEGKADDAINTLLKTSEKEAKPANSKQTKLFHPEKAKD
jgi:DNA repair exonuclease SbcCD nuclease subunit